MKKFTALITYGMLASFNRLAALLPEKYVRSALFFLLFKVWRYRYREVENNLNLCADALHSNRAPHLVRDYFLHLSRITAEQILSWHKSMSWYEKRINLQSDVMKLNAGRRTILLASHLGNWELAIPYLPVAIRGRNVYGVYKPLSNTFLDKKLKEVRGKFGLILMPMGEVLKAMVRDETGIFILINDQRPPNGHRAFENVFLGQKTRWFNGLEKIRARFEADVFYMQVLPEESGYIVGFEKIDSSSPLQTYTELLERDIKRNPEAWLWSHRRWKH